MAKRKKKTTTRPRKKRPIADPCPSYPSWSMARYRSFVRSAMRRAWLRWPPKYEALNLAKRKYEGPNARQKFEYQCAHCRAWFMGKEVSVDHIIPWGSLEGLSVDEAWNKLLVPVDQLQVLCNKCHKTKTKQENSSDCV